MRKKVMIVLNNLEMGGVKKSALTYIKERMKTCDVTLLVLSMQGILLQWLPSDIFVVETRSLYRYYGMAQKDCATMKDRVVRAVMVLLARLFGASLVQRIADFTVDDLGEFDEIVSYHHLGKSNVIYGGTGEFALAYAKKHPAETSCFIHCDYCRYIPDRTRTNRLYQKFDKILCVSEGTRTSFLKGFESEEGSVRSSIAAKTMVSYNIADPEMVMQLADQEQMPECMRKAEDDHRITLLSVARLFPEKGILRFVRILANMDCSRLRYVIVGDGKEEQEIRALISEKKLENVVILAGKQLNPYPYMKYADILVVPSYHEAAPVVFQEAEILSLPVLTTDTLSASEMVKNGWIVENNDADIHKKLRDVIEQWGR